LDRFIIVSSSTFKKSSSHDSILSSMLDPGTEQGTDALAAPHTHARKYRTPNCPRHTQRRINLYRRCVGHGQM
jgi:hypothetical protein